MTRRDRKRERTREDLIRAAVTLFEERGYEATTVDDIVERADYSRATFFRHFPTKEDVAFMGLPDRVAALQEVESAPPDIDLWQAARIAVTEQVLAFTAFAPELEATCLRLWFSEPALHRRYLELVVHAEDHLTRFLHQRAGDDEDTAVMCRVLASALIGVGRAVVRSQLTDESAVRKALDNGFGMIERGTLIDSLRPQARHVDRAPLHHRSDGAGRGQEDMHRLDFLQIANDVTAVRRDSLSRRSWSSSEYPRSLGAGFE